MTDYEIEKFRDFALSLTDEQRAIFEDVFSGKSLELAACPFCGGVAVFHQSVPRAYCTDCRAGTKVQKTYQEAAEAWNRRA